MPGSLHGRSDYKEFLGSTLASSKTIDKITKFFTFDIKQLKSKLPSSQKRKGCKNSSSIFMAGLVLSCRTLELLQLSTNIAWVGHLGEHPMFGDALEELDACGFRMKKSHTYVFCIQVFGYPKSSNLSGFAQKVGRHKIQWFIVPILYIAITWRKKTYVNKHQPVTHNSLQELGFHHPQPLQSQLDAFHLRSHGCVVAAHLVLQAPEAPAADFETAEGQLQG